jgi:hypothetical protein
MVRRWVVFFWSGLIALLGAGGVRCETSPSTNSAGVRFGEPVIQRYLAGVVIKAEKGACKRLRGTVPVPIDWPEQEVRIVEEDFSPEVKNPQYRTTDETVQQLLFEIPYLASGSEVHALVTFEVRRRPILAPEDPSHLKVPDRLARDIKIYLGPSPYIESRHAKIRSLAREIIAQKEDETAWTKVEAIYDYVRENVEYKEGSLKGALQALKDGEGDCEELTSLFIALCRAAGIPARTVWIPGHCYPEFYLVDREGQGHWFPCQAAGTRAFGEMPESRPILQKGDNFRVPEDPKERRRYLAESLKGIPTREGGEPRFRPVREILE